MPSYLEDLINSIIKTPVTQPQTVPDLNKPETWPSWLTQAVNNANNASTTQRNQVLSLIAGGGGDAKADAKDVYDKTVANNAQDAINRGLNNSTVASTMNAGAQRALARENQRVDESTADRAAGVIERQSMNGPDVGQFASLFRDAATKPLTATPPAGSPALGGFGYNGGMYGGFAGGGGGGLAGLYGGGVGGVTPAIPGVDPKYANIQHGTGSMTTISDGPVAIRHTDGTFDPNYLNYRKLSTPNTPAYALSGLFRAR
jgi:hypothetical protein